MDFRAFALKDCVKKLRYLNLAVGFMISMKAECWFGVK